MLRAVVPPFCTVTSSLSSFQFGVYIFTESFRLAKRGGGGVKEEGNEGNEGVNR